MSRVFRCSADFPCCGGLERVPVFPVSYVFDLAEMRALCGAPGGAEDVANEIPMTAEDVARLHAELEELKTVGRRRVRKDLAKALSFGDFRENAELDEAKRAHSMLEGRIADLVQLLGRVKVVEPGGDQRVAVGATVVASDLETQEEICLCVGMTDRADTPGSLVTPDSPVGRALMGRVVSDEIEVQTPSGARRYRILSVSFATDGG